MYIVQLCEKIVKNRW